MSIAGWHAYGKYVCVNGRNGTGVVTCDPADPSQQWMFDGTNSTPGALKHVRYTESVKTCLSNDEQNTGRVQLPPAVHEAWHVRSTDYVAVQRLLVLAAVRRKVGAVWRCA